MTPTTALSITALAVATLSALTAIAHAADTAPAKPAATPPKKPLASITCEEFTAIDDTFKPKVVTWGAAYAQGKKSPEAVVVDVEGSEKLTPMIIESCKSAPKASLWQKIEAEAKKLY